MKQKTILWKRLKRTLQYSQYQLLHLLENRKKTHEPDLNSADLKFTNSELSPMATNGLVLIRLALSINN